MKQTEINQWQKGLNLDTHPIAVTNKDLTSALNATMITMQGDEMVLQNDMGNARVESAYLPAGYVPVGMQEFGGIVYVASYNPLTHQSQIGSFPSPERNISSDEEGAPTIEIGSFFTGDCDDITTTVKKIKLTSEPLHPGDKYSVEMSNPEQYLDLYKNIDAGIYTLNLAVIDESGNLINISKEDITTSYEVKEDDNVIGNFFIRLISDHTEIIKDQQFNVYKGKIVGDLYLVLTLTIPQANEFNIYGKKVEGGYDIYAQMPQYSVTNNNGTPIVYNISGIPYCFTGKYKYAFADVNKSNLSIIDTFTYTISGLFEESADLDSAWNIISKVSIKTLEITESWQETNEGSYKATTSGIIKYKGKKYKTDIQLEREDSNDIKPYINTVDPVVYNDVFIGEDHKDSVSYTSMVQTESKKLDDSGNLVITIQKEYTYPELRVQTKLCLDEDDFSNLKSVYSTKEVEIKVESTDVNVPDDVNVPEIQLQKSQTDGCNIEFYQQDDYYIKSGVKIIPEYDYSFIKYDNEDALNNDTGTQLTELVQDTTDTWKLAQVQEREGFLKYKVTPTYMRNNECGKLPQLTVEGIYDLSKLASDTVTFDFDHYFDSVNNVLYLRILNAQTYLKQGSRISGWRFKYRDALLNGQDNVEFASIELPTRNTYGGTYTIQLYPKRSGKTNRGDDITIPEIVDASVGVCGIKTTGEPTIDIDGQTLYFTNDLLLDSILDCDIEIDVTDETDETDENKKITTSTSNKTEGSQYIFTFATRVKDGKACIDLDKSNVKIAWINKSLSIDFKPRHELTLPDIEKSDLTNVDQYFSGMVDFKYDANMLAMLAGQISVNAPFSLQSDEISEPIDEIKPESRTESQNIAITKIPTKLRGIEFKNILTNISTSSVSLFGRDLLSTHAQEVDTDGRIYTPITKIEDSVNKYKFEHWESYRTRYTNAHYHNAFWWDKNGDCNDDIWIEYGTCANRRYNDNGVKNFTRFDRVNPQRLFLMASFIQGQYSPKYEAIKLASGKVLVHKEPVNSNFELNSKWNNVYYPANQEGEVQVLKPKYTVVDYTPVYYEKSGTHQTKVKLLYKGVDVDRVKEYCCEGFNLNIAEELNVEEQKFERVYYFNYDFNVSETYPSPYTIPKIRDNSQSSSELAVTGFIDAGDKIYITSQRQNVLYLDPDTKTIKKCRYLHKTNAGYDTANITLTTKSFGETDQTYIRFWQDEDLYYSLDFFATEDD